MTITFNCVIRYDVKIVFKKSPTQLQQQMFKIKAASLQKIEC